MELGTLSDDQLFILCQEFGKKARQWRQKFVGLLPEVYKRNLFRTKGFASIYFFAAALGGVSENQVNTVLQLEKKFEKTPKIKKILVNGEVSHHKLARIASVVKPENEDFWSQQVKTLPQSALSTLVRDVTGKPGPKMLSANTELKLSPAITTRLLELQNKGVNISELIQELLEIRDEVIQNRKMRLAEKYKNTSSRHIPAEVLHIINEEYGTKCAVPTCQRPRHNNHHTLYFKLAKNHNPMFIIPLCKDHHAIAHAMDVKTTEMRMS